MYTACIYKARLALTPWRLDNVFNESILKSDNAGAEGPAGAASESQRMARLQVAQARRALARETAARRPDVDLQPGLNRTRER